MQTAHQRYLDTRHFPALDGLRAFSIVPVIWHHCSLVPLPGLLGKGPAGVQLFFVISGFLVTSLLLRERSQRGSISLGRFYLRRTLRIFPLYYAVLAGVTLHVWLSPPSASREHFLDGWIYFATHTSNWWVNWSVGHPIIFAFAWTLAVEEQFYALWPPLLRLTRGPLAACALMLGLLWLSQAVSWPGHAWAFGDGFWRTFCENLSSSIALGSLLAIALHERATFIWCREVLGARYVDLLLLLATLACLLLEVHTLFFHLVLCAWVGSCVLQPAPDPGRLPSGPSRFLTWCLAHPIAQYVGRASYALYLTHFVAVGAARRWVDPNDALLVFLCALPIALLLAHVCQRLLERPFLRLKRAYASA